MSLSVNKFILISSGLSAFIFIPLLALSAGIVEIIEKYLNILEKKRWYVFYKQLLNLLKSKSITEQKIYMREQYFINNLKYFSVEKYFKQTQFNGYRYTVSK